MGSFTDVYLQLSMDLTLKRIRSGVTDEELKEQFKALWQIRDDRYSDERTAQTVANRQRKKINMNYIGG